MLIFPALISNVAIAAFAMGDGAATTAGKIMGRNILPFNKGKTIGGLIFGLATSFLAASICADMARLESASGACSRI